MLRTFPKKVKNERNKESYFKEKTREEKKKYGANFMQFPQKKVGKFFHQKKVVLQNN